MLTRNETIFMPEWQRIPPVVKAYFAKYPDAGKYSRKKSHLSCSYLYDKKSNKFYPIAGKLDSRRRVATGRFGVVKRSQLGYVIKRQIIKNELELQSARREVEFTKQMGLAESELIECSFITSGYPYKVYQVMKYAGISLQKKIASEQNKRSPDPASTDNAKVIELKRAIRVCLEVGRLHGLGIAHRDLKPANIVENNQGQIHIIDFGLATIELDALLMDLVGTAEYMTVDAKYATSYQDKHITGFFILRQDPITSGYLTNRFSDKIALLRTIMHPDQPSILSHKLPSVLYKLLDTTVIKPHLDIKRCSESPSFFGAVLINYLKNNFNITEGEIENLRQNAKISDAIIQAYCADEGIDPLENALTITEEEIQNSVSFEAPASRVMHFPLVSSFSLLDHSTSRMSPVAPTPKLPVSVKGVSIGRVPTKPPLFAKGSPVVFPTKQSAFPEGSPVIENSLQSKRPFSIFDVVASAKSSVKLKSPTDEDDNQAYQHTYSPLKSL